MVIAGLDCFLFVSVFFFFFFLGGGGWGGVIALYAF